MNNLDTDKYNRAKKKMEEIKGFYTHLTVYLVINTLLILLQLGVFQNGFANIEMPSWSYFTTPFFWGIGLLFHGLYVFQDRLRFFKDWEDRKIKEFMDKDEEDYKKTTKWD